MKTDNKSYLKSTLYLSIGELIVSIFIVLGYILLDELSLGVEFTFKVITGALLGSVVAVVNFLILTIQVNRALDEFIALRGDSEMTDEEATEFSRKYSIKVQNAMAKSSILRTALMIGSLVLGFISGWFNVIATLIPLVLYKPLIYAVEIINKKRGE